MFSHVRKVFSLILACASRAISYCQQEGLLDKLSQDTPLGTLLKTFVVTCLYWMVGWGGPINRKRMTFANTTAIAYGQNADFVPGSRYHA